MSKESLQKRLMSLSGKINAAKDKLGFGKVKTGAKKLLQNAKAPFTRSVMKPADKSITVPLTNVTGGIASSKTTARKVGRAIGDGFHRVKRIGNSKTKKKNIQLLSGNKSYLSNKTSG